MSNGGTSRPYALYDYLYNRGHNVKVITGDNVTNIECFNSILRCKYWKNYGLLGLITRSLSFALKKIGFFFLNDLYWQFSVYKKFKSLKTDFDYIYSTYPTVDSITVGLIISKIYKIRIITELRDGLLFEPLEKLNKLQKFFLKIFESYMIRNSNKVVTIGKAITENLVHNYGYKEKIVTCYNGYDENDFLGIKNQSETIHENNFIHLGSIKKSKNRKIDLLINSIEKFVSDPKNQIYNVTFTFLGDLTKDEIDKITNTGLEKYIKIRNPISKKLALKEAMQYKFCLFYGVPGQKTYISSKVFDYIRLGKPILGICSGNESEQILSDIKNCRVSNFDTDNIVKNIEEIIKENYTINTDYTKFSRLNTLKRIETLFD